MQQSTAKVQLKKLMEAISARRDFSNVAQIRMGGLFQWEYNLARGSTAMEQVNETAANIPVWLTKCFAAVVTADVWLVILRHWKSFDGVSKFLGVALLAWLIMIPVDATWRWIGPRRFHWSNLWPTYMILLMTTLLFSR